MEGVVKLIFGISGNVIALFLFLSPVPTFWRIIKGKSTEDFSGVPYNMTLLNCLLYGLPFVSPNNILVSTINGAGSVIEIVYVVIFLVFASSQRTRLRMLRLASAVACVFAVVVLVSMLALGGQGRKLFCSLGATICSICMYASSLSIMRPVVKTKSVMPFLLSLAVFLCGTSWFIYGLLRRDPFVSIPNGCGSFLDVMQLILYTIYRNSGKATVGRDGKQQVSNDMEMADNPKSSKKVADDAGAGKEDRQV